MSTEPRRIALHGTPDTSAACFTPDGLWILTGSVKGVIRLVDGQDGRLVHELPCQIGASMIREIVLDEQSRHVAVNMNDRTVRTLRVTYNDGCEMPTGLTPTHKFQDLVSRTPWSGIGLVVVQSMLLVAQRRIQLTTSTFGIWTQASWSKPSRFRESRLCMHVGILSSH